MTFFMSDNIFISWSKSKSREFAFEVKNLLETLNPHLNIFMSEDNISAGEKVQEKIIQKISECDKYCCVSLVITKNLHGYYMKPDMRAVKTKW